MRTFYRSILQSPLPDTTAFARSAPDYSEIIRLSANDDDDGSEADDMSQGRPLAVAAARAQAVKSSFFIFPKTLYKRDQSP